MRLALCTARSRIARTLVLAAVASWAATARAQDVPVAVLGIEPIEGVPDAVATELTQALRQAVGEIKSRRVVPGKDLMEIKLVFSCPDEAPACMMDAARSLAAGELIYGSVRRAARGRVTITLKLLDTTSGSVERTVTDTLPQPQARGVRPLEQARRWAAELLGDTTPGVMRVRANVPGAVVTLDGVTVGTIGSEPLILSSVSPGRHDIGLVKDGYPPVTQTVQVDPGDTVDVSLSLSGAVGAIASTGDRGGPSIALKSATWGFIGAGALGLALAIKFGMDVKSVNEDLDKYRRFPCAGMFGCIGSPTGPEAQMPLTPIELAYVQSRKDEGNKAQTLQYVFYGISAACLATGGFLFYHAYVDGPRGDGSAAHASPRRTLTLAPVFAPGGGALFAHLAF